MSETNEWTASDRAEIGRLRREYVAEGYSVQGAYDRAYKSHYSRTGRVPSHGTAGYRMGCRCRPCTNAATESVTRSRRKAREGTP